MTEHVIPDQVFGLGPSKAIVEVDFLVQLQDMLSDAVRANEGWCQLGSSQFDALGRLGAVIDAAKGKTRATRMIDFFLSEEEPQPQPEPEGKVVLAAHAVARITRLAKIINALRDGSTLDHIAYHLGVTRDAVRQSLHYDGFAFFGNEVMINNRFAPRGTQAERDAELALLDRLIDEHEGVRR